MSALANEATTVMFELGVGVGRWSRDQSVDVFEFLKHQSTTIRTHITSIDLYIPSNGPSVY